MPLSNNPWIVESFTTEGAFDKVWRNDVGMVHREDGPAIEWGDGRKHWYLNGKEYDVLEWLLKVHEMRK